MPFCIFNKRQTNIVLSKPPEKRTPNLSFLKIIPFMLVGRSNITYDGIKAKLGEFEQMDQTSFQFLNLDLSQEFDVLDKFQRLVF